MNNYINTLAIWCKRNGLTLKLNAEQPAGNLSDIHDDLGILHCDHSKVRATWNQGKLYGGIRVSSPDWIRKINTEHTNHQYSNSEIINSGYDKTWWNQKIATFRSLYQFHEEGNGDGLYINRETGGIYFLAHDWMDWISKDPPMFKVSESISELYSQWSKIGFAWPRSLYWMNTYKNAAFCGFNNIGFGTL